MICKTLSCNLLLESQTAEGGAEHAKAVGMPDATLVVFELLQSRRPLPRSIPYLSFAKMEVDT